MAVYDINEYRKQKNKELSSEVRLDSKAFYSRFAHLKNKGQKQTIISLISTRLIFFFLWIVNLFWLVLALLAVGLFSLLQVMTCFQSKAVQGYFNRSLKQLKRSGVCLIALLIALFNPALGIMFSCLYFMMYDKMGIDEIIPPSLKEQFKEFFP